MKHADSVIRISVHNDSRALGGARRVCVESMHLQPVGRGNERIS